MNKFKYLSILLVALLLGACGGGGDNSLIDGGNDGGGDVPSGVDCEITPLDPECLDEEPDPPVAVEMGNGVGAGFTENEILVGLPFGTDLAPGGTTSLSVTLVLESDNGVYYTDEFVDVTFSSNCITQGLSAIDLTPVTTGSGTATVTYTAQGCTGIDIINAAAVVEGTVLTATGSVSVATADVNSISFVSADPQIIGLKGTGGLGFDETSDVTFRVVDAVGLPVSGADVSFSLDSTVGGLSLSPDTATSDVDGIVQTVVTSGTVSGTVRVAATVDGTVPVVGTQSSSLVVETGLPDQDSMATAVVCSNIEAWNYLLEENEVTVALGDRFNNPAPDGTSVSFTAEGGFIEPSCSTTTVNGISGVCTVTWSSNNPKPSDGRVTVLAHTIGEETFNDSNGNGVFDAGDSGWTDIEEVFRDDNENGTYDSAIEPFFFDFNTNDIQDTPDGYFNGILCEDPVRCQGADKTGIGDSAIIIMSGSTAFISDDVGGFLDISGGSGTVEFTIGDLHNQPMPAGTTVTLETGNGEIFGSATKTQKCTSFNGPQVFSFTINSNDEEGDVKAAVLTVLTPKGNETTYNISVSDVPPP